MFKFLDIFTNLFSEICDIVKEKSPKLLELFNSDLKNPYVDGQVSVEWTVSLLNVLEIDIHLFISRCKEKNGKSKI